MSQFAPPPGPPPQHDVPPAYPGHPPGYPGHPPGYAGQPWPPQPVPPRRTNGLAIASLVCGVVGCVPFVTSLAAVALGIIGLRKARDPGVGGKPLAVAGLVLGIVGLAGWTLFGGGLLAAYAASKPARAVADQFARDLSAGNVDAAAAATAGTSPQQLDSAARQVKPWGALTDTTFLAFSTRADLDGTTTCDLTGTATFATGGQKAYTVSLVKRDGTFKVRAFDFR